ncbi:RNA polymerase factor sigma-54 [Hippea jasoniae]|uniref:RNA polymerase factor sigma-54 n=1 Tax=Hippea jasoniae TaxID=944479 RepID=UPI000558BBE0|nr:RNA polymerase factor sigma-54 [Hippea jasoniae]
MIELRVDLEAKLGLILTPRIDLSLKILAMNIAEVEEKLNELLETNPIIKIDEGLKETTNTTREDRLKEVDEAFKERFSSDDESVSDIIEATARQKTSLQKNLLLQLGSEIELDEKDKLVAESIVYNLDEKGFLSSDIEEIARQAEVSIQRVEFIRKRIMNLEPSGCGCKNTEEFLSFQAKESGFEPQLIETILSAIVNTNRADIKRLKQLSGLSDEEFTEAMEIIRGFKLFPLENYSEIETTDYIYPDVRVKKIGGRLIAFIEENRLNRISIDEQMLNEYLKDKDAEEFVKDKYRQAKEFILAITNRNKTLLKTVNIILEKQKEFFENGTIKPLTRKQIAQILGYNVSTITRAVANKYLEFEGSIIPLSKFFSSGIDENTSKDYIKSLITEMINNEDKKNPLSDDAIKQYLAKKGINITRRTITKYRKELKIPSSRKRKCQDTL